MKKLLIAAIMIASIGFLGVSCTKDYSEDIVGQWDCVKKEHFMHNHLVSENTSVNATWTFTEEGILRIITTDGTTTKLYTIIKGRLKVKDHEEDSWETEGDISIKNDMMTLTYVLEKDTGDKMVTTLKKKASGHHS